MAPKSEFDASVYDVFAPVRHLKVVDKASTLPVVNTVLSEVASLTSPVLPYVDQTVATLMPLVDVAKSKVEETVVPRLPEGTTEVVKSKLDTAMSTLTEAVEKVDTYACGGVDQLLEKMPVLKEQTPTLVQTTKDAIVTQTDNLVLYYSSFSLALFALKVVDSSLSILEQTLECVRVPDDNKVASGIRMVHGYANTKRIQAITKSGSEKARRIENASILGAFTEVLGLGSLLGAENNKTMYEDEHVKVIDNEDADGVEESNPVVVDTEAGHVQVTDEKVDSAVADEVEQAPVVNEEAEVASSPVPATDEGVETEVSDPVVINEEAEQVSVVEEVANSHIPETDEGVDTEESVPAVADVESEEVPVVDEETEGAESDTEEDLVVVNVGAEQDPVVDEKVKGADSDTEEEVN